MIDIKEGRIESLLQTAVERAKLNKEPQIASMTKEIQRVDPLHFFASAKELSAYRSFWTSTASDYWMVGAGIVQEITAGRDRFTETEEKWKKMLEKAVIHNPVQAPGTGIVAMGGMSFDPRQQKSMLWNNFADSSFIIPAFLLTVHQDKYYLTLTLEVNPEDQVENLAGELRNRESTLVSVPDYYPDEMEIESSEEVNPTQWKETVRCATDTIRASNTDKIVLARELRLKLAGEADITSVLNNLISTQSNSFVFAFERDRDCFIGASPERLVKLQQDHLLSTCLAGTAPRGKTEKEDKAIAKDLFNDDKNRSEHDFVVKMIRKAVEKYCTNVEIPDKPIIYPLRNLQHLYTPVTATLLEQYSIFDIIKELHPTPALGGVPRDASLEFIRTYEDLDRGWYGAPVGWLDSGRNGEFAVGIRSGLIRRDMVSLFAGCGVVKDSDPESEYEETKIKFKPMLSVLGG